MNPEALQEAHRLFVETGYDGDINRFKNLISTNQEALQEAHRLFIETGYDGDINRFKNLIGVGQQQPVSPKKKEEDGGMFSQAVAQPFEQVQQDVAQYQEEKAQEQGVQLAPEGTFLRQTQTSSLASEPINAPLELPSKLEERKVEADKQKVSDILSQSVEAVTKDVLNQGAESAKKQLEYYFKDAGFEFSPVSRYGFEDIMVKSPDGEQKMFSLGAGNLENSTQDIKQFIKQKTADISDIKKIEQLYTGENKKIANLKQVENELKRINQNEEVLKNDMKSYLAERTQIEDLQKTINQYPENLKNTAEFQNLIKDYNIKLENNNNSSKSLQDRYKTIETQQKSIQKAAGDYTKMKAEQGTFLGGLWNNITDGIGSIVGGWSDFTINRYWDNVPLTLALGVDNYKEIFELKKQELNRINKVEEGVTVSDKLVNEAIRDDYKKLQKYGKIENPEGFKFEIENTTLKELRDFFRETFGTATTSKEFTQKLEKEGNIVQRGLLGLAKSAPAMVGGPYMRILNMFAQTSGSVLEEMENDPDFKNISENERERVASVIGVVGAALEEFGFRNVIKGTSIIKGLTGRIITKLPSNATASQIRSATLAEIKNMGIKGGVALIGSGLAEAETGGLQQASEYLLKDIYNFTKEKEMFDTPEFLSGEYLSNIADAAATEAVGGFMLGVPNAISTAMTKDGFQALDDDTFKLFEEISRDSDSRKFFVINLKNKINQGEVTAEQGKKMIEAYDQASGMIAQVPDEITDSKDRKTAMDLLAERKKLEIKKQGKDSALTGPIQKKIDIINEQLNQLTENAIQKQAAGETIPTEISSLNDNEVVTFRVASLEDVPEEFRDKAKEIGGGEIETRQLIFGLPFGKKETVTVPKAYVYSLTGKEAKDYAVQKQTAGQVPVQSETGVSQEMVEGESQPGLEVLTEEGVITEEKPKEEVAPPQPTVEFTEQDRARQQELTDALAKADKRRKNITVGETTMPKADVKAEIDALNQKELSSQQPAVEMMTPEQEADKLEQMMLAKMGPKVEAAPVTETPTEQAPTTETAPVTEVATETTEEVKGSPWDIVNAEEKAYREKQQKDKDQAASDIELINNGDQKTIDKYFKKSGYVEITGTETNPNLKGRKGVYKQTGASLIIKGSKQKAALDTATNISKKKIQGLPSARVEQIVKEFEKKSKQPKAETAPVTEGKVETENEKTAKRIRGKKMKGTLSTLDFGITQTVYNGALEFMARQVESGTKIGEAITATINWIDTKVGNIKWDKESFSKYMNSAAESMMPKRKAKEILDVYPKGSTVSIVELAKETKDEIVSNVLTKMKDVFKSVKISGRRPTEGAAFYNYNTKEIDVNKNSPHWDEVEGDQIASALSHEFTHHLIDAHPEKESIENELQQIKDDLIANKPELADNQKQAYEFMTAKNNSPQEILTYAVSDPDIRQVLEKYKDKLNNISNKIFGQDIISAKFAEQTIKENEKVQSQRGGDRRGRTESREITPLEGAPSVPGFSGPDPQLVAVAEEYARENGIPYKRQGEYVKVDEVRAKRIAQSYEDMKHDPKNPKVKEAYENLIKQTIAQYEALVKAGYNFWFIDTNIPSNQEYAQSPFNAMRDIRNNKEMGVFPTTDGFGSSDIDVKDNPLMAETKFKWPVGGLDGKMKPVLANDLFRAVHDAFGHGLEGAGFRARGEENAWQAHIRLFTGSAVGAITSETRGQNSWLNFGPYAENNRTANTDDTVFADQKTGLMPEWTWKEGVSPDMKEDVAEEKMPSLSEVLKKLIIKGPGGLQSNVLGVPIAIWNAGIKTVIKAIDAGKGLADQAKVLRDAIAKGYAEIKDNYKAINKERFEAKVLNTIYSNAIEMARNPDDPKDKISDAGIKIYLMKQGLTESQADALLAIKPKAKEKIAGKPKLDETKLPGYNEMMDKVDAMITRQTKRGTSVDKMAKNLDALLRKFDAYINATDAQKKALEQEARNRIGADQRRSPSMGRILGAFKDITNLGFREKNTILNNIMKLAKDAAIDLANEIKGMEQKGKITIAQLNAIQKRLSKVNFANESSISSFVDYMANVFKDVEYANKIANANKQVVIAKKNLRTKIGVSEVLTPLLQRLFNMKPTLIPMSVFEEYLSIVDMIGKRQTELSLQESQKLTARVKNILEDIDNELSTLDILIDIFNEFDGKVINENDNIDFSNTLNAMVDKKVITSEDADLLKKYKSQVIEKTSEPKMTEEQKAEEKKELIESVKDSTIDESNLVMREERDAARKLKEQLGKVDLDSLTNSELKNILKVINNINNGFFSAYAKNMSSKLESLNNQKTLTNAIKTAGRLPLTNILNRLKSMLPYQKTAEKIGVNRTPKFFIDQVFGFFKETPIFSSVFEKTAQFFDSYQTDKKSIQEKLETAFNKVAKLYWKDPRAVRKSTFKMMTYALQLEYESNKDSGKFYSAADYILETINHAMSNDSTYSSRDVELLEQILKDYGKVVGKDKNGNDIIDIDINKLYNSFKPAEKNAIKTFKEINESLKDKVLFTSAVIRGDKANVINNYVHHNVLPTGFVDKATSGTISANQMSQNMQPSTRAKSLIERTPGVKPLNFDIFSVTQKSANQVLLDYHLTDAVRTARRTLAETKKAIAATKNKEQMAVFNAIEMAYESALDTVLMNTFNDDSFATAVTNFMTKQAYRTILASTSKWFAETLSNLSFVLTAAPKEYINGVTKYRKVVMTDLGPKVMRAVNSTVQDRTYSGSLSGRMIDTQMMNDAVGLDGSTTKNAVANAMQTIYNNTLKKYTNTVATTADSLISTPDKSTIRPLWFGVFADNFKNFTKQEVDYNKIAESDEAYMNQFKEAIEYSRKAADQMVVFAGTTNNPFASRQSGQNANRMSGWAQIFSKFDNFMNNFIVYEYITARTAIYAMMGNGMISRRRGIALMAGVTLRTSLYSLLIKEAGVSLLSLILGDDEEEEKEPKTWSEKVYMALTGSIVSLMLGRDFGNMTRSMINYGVEKINEKYIQQFFDGKYTMDDAITYSVIPNEKRPEFVDLMINMTGPMQPYAKLAKKSFERATQEPPKKPDAIKKRENDIYVNIPLEAAGNLGLVPLYKDVKKVTNAYLRREVDSIVKDMYESSRKGIYEGFETEEEFMIANPKLYREKAKRGGELYEYKKKQAEQDRQKEVEKAEELRKLRESRK